MAVAMSTGDPGEGGAGEPDPVGGPSQPGRPPGHCAQEREG